MTSEKIVAAALQRFACHGYDATTLAEIAGDVGIRKPSIYAHFPSKRALFMHILERSSQKALGDIDCLLSEGSIPALKKYILNIHKRFKEDDYLLFWLRALYLPPVELAGEISDFDIRYANHVDKRINQCVLELYKGPKPKVQEMLVDAYTGIIRGIHAELLYHGADRAMQKATAMWEIFEIALTLLLKEDDNGFKA